MKKKIILDLLLIYDMANTQLLWVIQVNFIDG